MIEILTDPYWRHHGLDDYTKYKRNGVFKAAGKQTMGINKPNKAHSLGRHPWNVLSTEVYDTQNNQ